MSKKLKIICACILSFFACKERENQGERSVLTEQPKPKDISVHFECNDLLLKELFVGHGDLRSRFLPLKIYDAQNLKIALVPGLKDEKRFYLTSEKRSYFFEYAKSEVKTKEVVKEKAYYWYKLTYEKNAQPMCFKFAPETKDGWLTTACTNAREYTAIDLEKPQDVTKVLPTYTAQLKELVKNFKSLYQAELKNHKNYYENSIKDWLESGDTKQADRMKKNQENENTYQRERLDEKKKIFLSAAEICKKISSDEPFQQDIDALQRFANSLRE